MGELAEDFALMKKERLKERFIHIKDGGLPKELVVIEALRS